MQIHYALKNPPRWKNPELGQVALLHLAPGLDEVSKAVNECERRMLPAVPTICLGQPHALDPSRCPAGAGILWIQLPEAPRHIKGDAAGEIAAPLDGRWTEAVRERYADRVEKIIASHIEGFAENVVARRAFSPADLEAMNVNLVGGDPYGGSCTIDQSFIWRPFSNTRNHETSIRGLYQIGASTHPGPRAFRRLGIRTGGELSDEPSGAASKIPQLRSSRGSPGAYPLLAKSGSTTSPLIF